MDEDQIKMIICHNLIKVVLSFKLFSSFPVLSVVCLFVDTNGRRGPQPGTVHSPLCHIIFRSGGFRQVKQRRPLTMNKWTSLGSSSSVCRWM